jgi:hypothetical protein
VLIESGWWLGSERAGAREEEGEAKAAAVGTSLLEHPASPAPPLSQLALSLHNQLLHLHTTPHNPNHALLNKPSFFVFTDTHPSFARASDIAPSSADASPLASRRATDTLARAHVACGRGARQARPLDYGRVLRAPRRVPAAVPSLSPTPHEKGTHSPMDALFGGGARRQDYEGIEFWHSPERAGWLMKQGAST